MTDTSKLDERRASLGAALADAMARAQARRNMDNDSIGAVLGVLNDDLDQIVHTDRDEADRAYDRIEARLAAERIRIEDDLEDEDR
jgi:hypothetical protein